MNEIPFVSHNDASTPSYTVNQSSQIAKVGEFFYYHFPSKKVFGYNNSDNLTCIFAESGKNILPWEDMNFNEENCTLLGHPTKNETGVYNISITATDTKGQLGKAFFLLDVVEKSKDGQGLWYILYVVGGLFSMYGVTDCICYGCWRKKKNRTQENADDDSQDNENQEKPNLTCENYRSDCCRGKFKFLSCYNKCDCFCDRVFSCQCGQCCNESCHVNYTNNIPREEIESDYNKEEEEKLMDSQNKKTDPSSPSNIIPDFTDEKKDNKDDQKEKEDTHSLKDGSYYISIMINKFRLYLVASKMIGANEGEYWLTTEKRKATKVKLSLRKDWKKPNRFRVKYSEDFTSTYDFFEESENDNYTIINVGNELFLCVLPPKDKSVLDDKDLISAYYLDGENNSKVGFQKSKSCYYKWSLEKTEGTNDDGSYERP